MLQTRLHPPQVLAQTIDRPRLWERLDAGVSGPLTIVAAPAGYGKTTLVSSWLKVRFAGSGARPGFAWLSLDERDNDGVLFLRHLCMAISQALPGPCAASLAMLNGPGAPPFAELVREIASDLEGLPESFVLVLDDSHTVADAVITSLLAELVRFWPPHLHLVLITRHLPDVPLATLRAKGLLTELTTDDLRFTADEVETYLSQVAKAEPSAHLIEQMENQTEGWAAGLNLATLALRRKGTIVRLTSQLDTSDHLYNYLTEDVLANEPPEIADFLCQIAILDRWCLPLCQAVTNAAVDDSQAEAALNWLERTNFFIVPLDGHREWYRFHRLLSDALQRRAAMIFTPAQTADAHRRAAGWFMRHGQFEDALHHAVTIQDFNLAAEVVEAGFPEALDREDRLTLERWLQLFPAAFIEGHPGLLCIRVVAEQMAWRFEAIGRDLALLKQHLEGSTAPHTTLPVSLLAGTVRCIEAILAYFTNQMEASEAYAVESLSLLPSNVHFLRGGAMIFWGAAAQGAGRAAFVEPAIWAEYDTLPDRATSYAIRILQALTCSALQGGRLNEAHHCASLMQEKAEQGGYSLMLGWAHFWLGLIHFEWNELPAARQHFAAVTERRYDTHAQAARHSMIGLTMIEALHNDWTDAFRTLALASEYDVQLIGGESRETQALRAWIHGLRGDHVAALRWVNGLTTPVPNRPLVFFLEAHLVKVRLLIGLGSSLRLREEALPLLDAFDDLVRRTNNLRYQVHLAAYRAAILAQLGDQKAATASLQRALALGRSGSFTRAFIGHGGHLQALLARIAGDENLPEADDARRILASLVTATGSGTPAELEEPLTAREIDVLTLMQQRMSDKEISAQLSISIGTVKRHSANLYGKLGVNKRWDAVSRAEELGILHRI